MVNTKVKKNNSESAIDQSKKAMVLGALKRKATPSIFKIRSRKAVPIVFTLDDVQEIIKTRRTLKKTPALFSSEKESPASLKNSKVEEIAVKSFEKQRVLGAASLSDILGFNPNDIKSRPISSIDETLIPRKHMKHYRALVELRSHVKKGLDLHAQDTLKRSSKEDTGDLSSYSQHMADAGTDTFDRDCALNLLSNEQDALFEIEDAIQRILNETYGVCEITGEKISPERLDAVPFTRYSLEGRKQLESTKRGSHRERGSIFSESSIEESAKYTEEEVES